MQNIFTRVKVKIAEGVSVMRGGKGNFNRVFRLRFRAEEGEKVSLLCLLLRSHPEKDHKKLFIFHGNFAVRHTQRGGGWEKGKRH